MAKIGTYNGLTDIDGILVGHYTDFDAVSGITVVVCPKGAVASCPKGTREDAGLVRQETERVIVGGYHGQLAVFLFCLFDIQDRYLLTAH